MEDKVVEEVVDQVPDDLEQKLDAQVKKAEKFEDFFQFVLDILVIQPVLRFLKHKIVSGIKKKIPFVS